MEPLKPKPQSPAKKYKLKFKDCSVPVNSLGEVEQIIKELRTAIGVSFEEGAQVQVYTNAGVFVAQINVCEL